MIRIAGLVLLLAGIALGLYVGVWLCLIGGIVQIIEAAKATPVHSLHVALGIVRLIFAGPAGWISFFAVGGTGWFMLTKR